MSKSTLFQNLSRVYNQASMFTDSVAVTPIMTSSALSARYVEHVKAYTDNGLSEFFDVGAILYFKESETKDALIKAIEEEGYPFKIVSNVSEKGRLSNYLVLLLPSSKLGTLDGMTTFGKNEQVLEDFRLYFIPPFLEGETESVVSELELDIDDDEMHSNALAEHYFASVGHGCYELTGLKSSINDYLLSAIEKALLDLYQSLRNPIEKASGINKPVTGRVNPECLPGQKVEKNGRG